MISNFCQWKKFHGNVSLIRKNLDYGIDTLKLEIPNFTRSIKRYIRNEVRKQTRLIEKTV